MSRAVRKPLLLLLMLLLLAWLCPFAAPSLSSRWVGADEGESTQTDRPSLASAAAQERAPQSADPVASDSTTPMAQDPLVDAAARVSAQRTTLSRAEARELMRRVITERDCEQAAYAATDHSKAQLEWHFWRWLPPEQAAYERAARSVAAARLAQGCAPVPTNDEALKRRRRAHAADEAAALAAGDLLARLRTPARDPGRPTVAEIAQIRGLLYDAVLSGDVELIAHIGAQERWLDTLSQDEDLRAVSSEIWQLVACDLGRDCGADSFALARICLYVSSSACGMQSVEAAIRQTQFEGVYRLMDQRRRELVARIRSGQIAGMFDPPPPDGGP